jgi:predicted nucleotidyltransferase
MDKEARRKELLAEAKKLARKIAEEYEPERIILFGSAATGEVTEDSDVDLFVVKDTNERGIKRDQRVRGLLLGFAPRTPLDVVVYTPYEVEWRSKGGDPFVLDVLETGRILYERK